MSTATFVVREVLAAAILFAFGWVARAIILAFIDERREKREGFPVRCSEHGEICRCANAADARLERELHRLVEHS